MDIESLVKMSVALLMMLGGAVAVVIALIRAALMIGTSREEDVSDDPLPLAEEEQTDAQHKSRGSHS